MVNQTHVQYYSQAVVNSKRSLSLSSCGKYIHYFCQAVLKGYSHIEIAIQNH